MRPRTRILHTLASHPWSTAAQVSGLTGITSSVYYHLNRLVDNGLVQTAQAPLIRARLHAPSEAGIIQLAGGKRKAKAYARALCLDSYRLAGALLRAQSLSMVRDFFVEVATSATGGYLQWADSPYHASVGRRLLKLDGYGIVLWLGEFHRFAVLADPGGLAVQGYVPLFKRFLRWREGEQFASPTTRPILVMLTTYERRAHQLTALWHREVKRTERGGDSELFVGLGGDAAADGGPARWWRAKAGGQGALWRGCRGSTPAIPRPRPALVSSQRERAVQLVNVDDWREGTQRGREVRVFLSLSGQMWRVLNQVGTWPLLRSGDLARLANYGTAGAGLYSGMLQDLTERGLVRVVHREDAERALKELRHAQLEGKLAKADEPVAHVKLMRRMLTLEDELAEPETNRTSVKRYVLSPRGLRLLAAARGMSPLAYGRARHWPVACVQMEGERVVDLRIKRLLLSWDHTQLANEFFLGLRRLAERQWAMGRNHRLLIWDSWESRRWYHGPNGKRLILPDGGGVYQIGEEAYEFWLEIDRGGDMAAPHRQALRRKFERFYLYRQRPDSLHGRSMPRILLVARQIGRAQAIRDIIMSLARERGEPPLCVYITTLDDIWLRSEREEDGTLVPHRQAPEGPGRPPRKRMWPGLKAWRRAAQFGRYTWCFEGLGRMPPGTQRAIDRHQLRRDVRAHTNRSEAQRQRRQRERMSEAATCNGS